MSSWYSNLVTKTSSQLSSLRSTLLSSEADGDTEDDTHVCRVLRNHYSEKGRPLPPWLPPDPKAVAAAAGQPGQTTLYAQPQAGSRYGAGGGGGTHQQQQQQQQAGGLSSLWDSSPAQPPLPPPQNHVPQSLRAGRPPPAAAAGGRDDRPAAQGSRVGSFPNSTTGGGTASTSAQDRLRQRLWGTRTTSPSSSQQGPFQPPPSSSSVAATAASNYEDRFAPGGSYDGARSSGGSDIKPYMGANSPWASGGDDNTGAGGARQGLSSRQGLPSGPRGYR